MTVLLITYYYAILINFIVIAAFVQLWRVNFIIQVDDHAHNFIFDIVIDYVITIIIHVIIFLSIFAFYQYYFCVSIDNIMILYWITMIIQQHYVYFYVIIILIIVVTTDIIIIY